MMPNRAFQPTYFPPLRAVKSVAEGCYVRHHLSLNRRLQPAVRQGQFLHSSQTSAGHRRRKIGRYSFAIVGSSQAFHGYQKRPAYEPHGICDRFPSSTPARHSPHRSEEHTSELQSLMRISYAVCCLKKKTNKHIFLTTTN